MWKNPTSTACLSPGTFLCLLEHVQRFAGWNHFGGNIFLYPDAPCMECLPTFRAMFRVNVGKYSIHGASGYRKIYVCFFVSKNPAHRTVSTYPRGICHLPLGCARAMPFLNKQHQRRWWKNRGHPASWTFNIWKNMALELLAAYSCPLFRSLFWPSKGKFSVQKCTSGAGSDQLPFLDDFENYYFLAILVFSFS